MKKKKIIVCQYDRINKVPKEIKEYWLCFTPFGVFGPYDAIFAIEGKEVIVRNGDYLVYKDKKLFYYPKEIWESRANREFISYKSEGSK